MKLRERNTAFTLLLCLFFILGCDNQGENGFSILPASLQSTESRVSRTYLNYIEKISTSDFALSGSLRKNGTVVDNLDNWILANPDLLFFSSTLWQMYVLNDKENWKQNARKYSSEVAGAVRDYNMLKGEVIQSVYVTPYKLNPSKESLDKIIESLSKQISAHETNNYNDKKDVENNLDLLLENKIMFLATKETGDPVFRNFALENTSFLLEECFRRDLRLVSVLTNDISEKNLAILRTEDFYKLAVGICGFNELYKETGIDEYLTYCKAIATIFTNVLVDENMDAEIKNKVDLVSQSLVSLALLDLSGITNDSYSEISHEIYENVLRAIELNQSRTQGRIREEGVSNESFRLYYYLFEYELRKQELI